MQIKISVVVPVFNAEKYLERCLISIQNQTLQEIEIILIDDGSTDLSGSICEKNAKADSRIHVYHKDNGGITSARRYAMDHINGEYILFVDADDYIAPEMCASMYEAAKKNVAKVVVSNFIEVKDNKTSIKKSFTGEELTIENFFKSLVPGYLWSKLFHASLKESFKVDTDISQAEDLCVILPLVSYLCNDSDLLYIDEAYYYYYRHEESNSANDVFVNNYGIEEYLKAIKHIITHTQYVIFYCLNALYWGINNVERQCFKAEYIEFIRYEIYPYLCGNSLLAGFKHLYSDLICDIIPPRLVYVTNDHIENDERICIFSWKTWARNYEFIELDINPKTIKMLPLCVQVAFDNENILFVEDYLKLKEIYEHGGIAISPSMKLCRPLGQQRLNKCFFGYKNENEIGKLIYGAVAGNEVIEKLLRSYEDDTFLNDAFCDLEQRIQIVLQGCYGLIPKGIECFLKRDKVKLYHYRSLYRRVDKKNISYLFNHLDELAEKENKVLIDIPDEYGKNNANIAAEYHVKELENQVKQFQDIINDLQVDVEMYKVAYQHIVDSTSWKITGPIRKLLDVFRRSK